MESQMHNRSLPNIKLLANSDNDLRTKLNRRAGGSCYKRKSSGYSFPSPKRKCTSNPSPPEPIYKDHLLLGDSQFVRFAQKLLSYKRSLSVTEDTGSRRIGYCVSGQKIRDLKNRLLLGEFELLSKVIVLIGTNDIVYNTDISNMCRDYAKVLDYLKTECRKIVLLTVPPVPRMEDDTEHWVRLKILNKFIQQCEDGRQIFVLDLGSLFISYNNTVSIDYFERTFYGGDREDLIHLNLNGFKMLKSIVDNFYFNEDNDTE